MAMQRTDGGHQLLRRADGLLLPTPRDPGRCNAIQVSDTVVDAHCSSAVLNRDRLSSLRQILHQAV